MSESIAASLARNRSRFEAFTRPATALLLRELSDAATILDLASGTGDPALALAQALPHARVIASDRVPALLDETARAAATRKLTNLHTLEADMHDLPLSAASVDSVVSRLGIQFARDVSQVLAEILRVLQPGGTTCHVVWGAPTQPLLRDIPCAIAQPGPFQFSQPGSLARALANAGLSDVEEHTHCSDWVWQGDALSFWQFMQETSADVLDPIQADEAVAKLRAFERGNTLAFPVEIHCGRARKR